MKRNEALDLIKTTLYSVIGKGMVALNAASFALQRDNGTITVFDTESGSDNLGDEIIMRFCRERLTQCFPKSNRVDISTHRMPSNAEILEMKASKYRFLCGTNLLTSSIEENWNWVLPNGFRKKLSFRNVILFGAGWHSYQADCTDYSKLIYHELFNPTLLHSVRDSYSEQKLKAAGIRNVINTGCPTMWRLTPDFCSSIPKNKAPSVITTITDYRRDAASDNVLLTTLGRSYDQVYLWLQGKKDEAYLKELSLPHNLTVIPRELNAYEEMLQKGNVDYIGTRLHAGIFALNHKVRSLIVSVDNRANEIAKDTHIPILPRRELQRLESFIFSDRETNIELNTQNITRFLEQFKN